MPHSQPDSSPTSSGLRIAPALVLAIGVLLSVGASLGVAAMAHGRDEARFEHAVDGAQDRIIARLDVYITLLRAGAAFMTASDDVTFNDFAAFVARFRVPEFYPGIQGLGYSARIRPASRDSLENALRTGPFPDFRIWPEDPPRDELHSIVYLFPLDLRNQAAIGFDMFSEETRRAAMSAARDSGRVIMSGRVTLVQEITGPAQAGFLLYAPVYESGTIPSSVERRREELRGFFYAPFRADDLFAGIFGSEHTPRVGFRVYDGDGVDDARLIHNSSEASVDPGGSRHTAVERFVIAGRPWTIVFSSTRAFEADSRRGNWILMLAAGLLATAILFFVARREVRARNAAELLAARLQSTGSELERQIAEVRELNEEIERTNRELVDAVEALRRSNAELEELGREADLARDEASRANQAKSAFLAAMSHEFRTPLNAIMGYTDLIEMGLEGPVTERQQRALGRIRRAQLHLLGLINDILSYARIEAGKLEVRMEQIPVVRLLADLEAMTAPQAASRGHRLIITSCSDDLIVFGDEEKIQQILINLLGNAIKFTDSGGVITVSVAADADRVRIQVEDTGPGIPPDRLGSVFDPFVQVDRSSARDGQHGVGLGLAISRDLAGLIGGSLTVESEVGKGSVFTLALPRAWSGARAAAGRGQRVGEES